MRKEQQPVAQWPVAFQVWSEDKDGASNIVLCLWRDSDEDERVSV